MSLACALRKTTIDAAIVQEVISDLDISQHMSKPHEADGHGMVAAAETGAARRPMKQVGNDDPLTPAQARAYLEQMARSLKGWQS
jgi:hypothetical protein